MSQSVASAATTFRVVLIKPSHYDDEGYVIRWMRSCIPSNTLGCLYSITEAVKTSGRLGPDVDVVIDVYDETNQRIPIDRKSTRLNSSHIQKSRMPSSA